jgi:hypothetical protein
MEKRLIKWQMFSGGKPITGRWEASDYETARFYTIGAAQTGPVPADVTVHPVINGQVFPIEMFQPDPQPALPAPEPPPRRLRRIPACRTRADTSNDRRSSPSRARMGTILLLAAVAVVWVIGASRRADSALPPGVSSLPSGIDNLATLAQVLERLDRCAERAARRNSDAPAAGQADPANDAFDCADAVYMWSPDMPLSRTGIAESRSPVPSSASTWRSSRRPSSTRSRMPALMQAWTPVREIWLHVPKGAT